MMSSFSRFHRRRAAALNGLTLATLLAKSNPYLFAADAMNSAAEIIGHLLTALVSSLDQRIFAEEFFEPICKAVSKSQIAAARGVDLVIETKDSYQAISFKSGPNAFTSSQVSKQNHQFEEIRQSLRATLRSLRKEFMPIMGCGYGRADSEPTEARKYYKLAGEAFWERVTGDADFYLKLVTLMRDDPDNHRKVFTQAWDRAVNRFLKEFTQDFSDAAGNILWEKLVQYNSGTEPPKLTPRGKRAAP
jgi:hypothetical protein